MHSCVCSFPSITLSLLSSFPSPSFSLFPSLSPFPIFPPSHQRPDLRALRPKSSGFQNVITPVLDKVSTQNCDPADLTPNSPFSAYPQIKERLASPSEEAAVAEDEVVDTQAVEELKRAFELVETHSPGLSDVFLQKILIHLQKR